MEKVPWASSDPEVILDPPDPTGMETFNKHRTHLISPMVHGLWAMERAPEPISHSICVPPGRIASSRSIPQSGTSMDPVDEILPPQLVLVGFLSVLEPILDVPSELTFFPEIPGPRHQFQSPSSYPSYPPCSCSAEQAVIY